MQLCINTVVGDYINTTKTTFGLYQAVKQYGYKKTWKSKRSWQIKNKKKISIKKRFFLITYRLFIRKMLINN